MKRGSLRPGEKPQLQTPRMWKQTVKNKSGGDTPPPPTPHCQSILAVKGRRATPGDHQPEVTARSNNQEGTWRQRRTHWTRTEPATVAHSGCPTLLREGEAWKKGTEVTTDPRQRKHSGATRLDLLSWPE